jgi:deoxyribodipyrimidine photolyase-related protein
MLNIGLITPQDVITVITNYYNKNKAQIGIANYEGFIRQIIGWREYQRYIYQYAGNVMRAGNYFNNARKLTPEWYKGTIGIKPVDDAIKMAINDGYIHHILRLMVVGNFMNLVGIHPDEVYKWFMEFSLDSYDWVMVGNVYSMTLWADGGLTMRKPYISGDGYIMKMSNYSRGDWNGKWNAIFHHFVDRTSKQLEKTYYNGLVKAWNRKPDDAKEDELAIANEIIKRISK